MILTRTANTELAPLSELTDKVCRNLIGVMTDIDDTLTIEGRLPADAYTMLEHLTNAGLLVIPITGRPAGWCDMIARYWPVAGIVGENGAIAMRYDHKARKMHRMLNIEGHLRHENRAKLNALANNILADVPGSALSSDQQYRETDLAIDFCEDVEPLSKKDVDRIVDHFRAAGAVAKVSSIHVNGWFGDWDKLTMSKRFLSETFDINLEKQRDQFIYCGDSPNDAPMFGFFPYSCGVANVVDFVGTMDALPRFIAPSHGGTGFVEIGERILRAHKSFNNN